MTPAVTLPRQWDRDLDLVVSAWHGGDDPRLEAGAGTLAARIPPAPVRLAAAPPEAPTVRPADPTVRPADPTVRPGDPAGGPGGPHRVVHRQAVLQSWQDQRAVLDARQPRRLLTLGGDCGVELPSVTHLSVRYGPRLRVVWLDAHGDLNSPGTSPSGTAHGMPLRLLLDPTVDDLGSWHCLEPAQVLLAGTRDLDGPEEQFRAQHDIAVIGVAELTADPQRLSAWLPAQSAVYVHVDLDVLDPVSFPAVAVPTPNGLHPLALAAALAGVHAQAEVVGIGITEYVPAIDHNPTALDPILAALRLVSTPATPFRRPTP